MSAGNVLLGIGLASDVLGTLFISLDALRGQTQATRVYDILAFITRSELIDIQSRSSDEETDKLVAQALAGVPADASDHQQALAAGLGDLNDASSLVTGAAKQAAAHNKKLLQEKLDKVSSEFSSRKHLIVAAIAAVFIGGVCEFVGGVILT